MPPRVARLIHPWYGPTDARLSCWKTPVLVLLLPLVLANVAKEEVLQRNPHVQTCPLFRSLSLGRVRLSTLYLGCRSTPRSEN